MDRCARSFFLSVVLASLPALPCSAASPPVAKPHMDLYGDPLPPDAVARLGSVRDRMAEGITSLAYLPGGDVLAAGSLSEGVIVLFSREGKKIRRLALEEPGSRLGSAIAFSSDGKLLAATSDNGDVLFWDMKTSKIIRKIRCSFGIGHLLLSSDGKRLAATGSRLDNDGVHVVGEGALWATDTGEQVCLFHPCNSALAFSPAGDLITATGGTIFLRDAQTGAEHARIDTEHSEILALAVAADGKMLASGGADKTIVLWDIATRKPVRRFTGHDGNVHFLAFTPDGKTLVSVRSVFATAHDGKTLVSSTSDRSCALWDVATGRCRHRFTAEGACALSQDGKTLATAAGNVIQRWNLTVNASVAERPSPLISYSVVPRDYKPLAFAPDGKTIACTGSSWSVWDAATGRMLRQWPTQPNTPLLGFSPKGKPILGAPCAPRKFWDFRTGTRFHVPRDPTLFGGSLIFMADGKRLAQVFRDEVIVSDADTGETIRRVRIKGGNDSAEATLSPDGRLVAWAFRGYPFIYDTGGEQLITLCSADSGEILRQFGSKRKDISSGGVANPLTFSADGRWLAASVSYDSLALWETSTGKERICTPREKQMHDLAFSPDGKLLAAACEDARVRVWETLTGQEVYQFRGHGHRVLTVTFSSDGTRLLTRSGDSTALVWDVAGQTLAAKLSPADVERLWDELGGEARRAFQARRLLTSAASQTVPFLGERLQALARSVPAERITRLITDLDSDQFAVRERTVAELKKLGVLIEPALRKTIASRPSLEARRRVVELLDRLDHHVLTSEELRGLRAVGTLEHIGGAEARRVLETLARGTPGFRLTDEARAAVERLSRRSAANP